MQGDEATNPLAETPQEPAEIQQLRAELVRLKEKRAQTDDADIFAVLDMRIKDVEAALEAQAEPIESHEDAPEPEESEEIKKLRVELEKLKEKRAQSKDRNINAVLDMRIAQIEPLLPPPPKPKAKPKKEAELDEALEFAKIPLPTAAEAEAAEKLIKQSMLEKRRGNAVGATDLLKKAAAAAPGSAVVLEALADDFVERKLMKQARETYKRAVQLDPKNVGLERKWANCVLGMTSPMSPEDMLRYGDSIFLTGGDNVAGLTAAKFLSALVPGVGQMVVGRSGKGIGLFLTWVIFLVLIAIWHKDFEELMRFIRGAGPAPSWKILFPLIGMAAIWIGSMGDLFSGQSRTVSRQTKIDRPKPPVDLPFE